MHAPFIFSLDKHLSKKSFAQVLVQTILNLESSTVEKYFPKMEMVIVLFCFPKLEAETH